MGYSCAIDIFKFCDGEPDWGIEPSKVFNTEGLVSFTSGGTCKLMPDTCGRCKTILEQIPPEMLEKISKSTFIQAVIPIKAEDKKTAKSKAAKKLEAELAQGHMF